MPRIEREKEPVNINTWAIGILVSLLSSIILTNQYWLNRNLVEMKTDVAVIRYAVFKTETLHSGILGVPSAKSPLLSVPLLMPLPIKEKHD